MTLTLVGRFGTYAFLPTPLSAVPDSGVCARPIAAKRVATGRAFAGLRPRNRRRWQPARPATPIFLSPVAGDPA